MLLEQEDEVEDEDDIYQLELHHQLLIELDIDEQLDHDELVEYVFLDGQNQHVITLQLVDIEVDEVHDHMVHDDEVDDIVDDDEEQAFIDDEEEVDLIELYLIKTYIRETLELQVMYHDYHHDIRQFDIDDFDEIFDETD